jgi:hypothetical protein
VVGSLEAIVLVRSLEGDPTICCSGQPEVPLMTMAQALSGRIPTPLSIAKLGLGVNV